MSTRVTVGGVVFDVMTFGAAVDAVTEVARRREKPSPFVVTPNVDHVLRLRESQELRDLYAGARFSFADGMPVIWASRLAGTPLPERVTGADLVPALCALAAREGLRVYLLGGPPGAAERAAAVLASRHPGLQVGHHCPSFGFEKNDVENERIIALVNAYRPDFLFVGVGAPKQERWIARFRDRLDVGISLGIGAAIEFEAGMIRRAPVWMRRVGAEWIWRMLSDPKRLVRRYAGNAAFAKVLWESWRGR